MPESFGQLGEVACITFIFSSNKTGSSILRLLRVILEQPSWITQKGSKICRYTTALILFYSFFFRISFSEWRDFLFFFFFVILFHLGIPIPINISLEMTTDKDRINKSLSGGKTIESSDFRWSGTDGLSIFLSDEDISTHGLCNM